MIRYALACEAGHEFESWFRSGSDYDLQVERGLVECPFCSSTKVVKRLMSPALGRTAAEAPGQARPVPDGSASGEEPRSQPVALLSEREQAIRAMLRAVREHVTRTSDYVGTGFADEARKMHYGEIEHRSIYGEADAMQARALAEEGIEVHSLPLIPDDRN
ncbi:MAG: hypothetical protein JWR08_832 [Enterovirga sp.]|nr:hypothetical protein [Enterovirga sp.]